MATKAHNIMNADDMTPALFFLKRFHAILAGDCILSFSIIAIFFYKNREKGDILLIDMLNFFTMPLVMMIIK